jgi:hypothetical protein
MVFARHGEKGWHHPIQLIYVVGKRNAAGIIPGHIKANACWRRGAAGLNGGQPFAQINNLMTKATDLLSQGARAWALGLNNRARGGHLNQR